MKRPIIGRFFFDMRNLDIQKKYTNFAAKIKYSYHENSIALFVIFAANNSDSTNNNASMGK